MATRFSSTHCMLIWFGVFLMSEVINCDQYCLKCVMANSITDCTSTVKCAAGEYCYTDQINHSGNVVYNAGCRQSSGCVNPQRVKRDTSDNLVTCSRCCIGHDRNATGHCNDRLCGLSVGTTNGLLQCYSCSNQRPVENCNLIETCQQDQICGTETHLVSTGGAANGTLRYYFGCVSKNLCLAGTKFILKHKELGDLGGLGRRRDTYMTTCKICCGGSLCNTGDCIELVEKLYRLKLSGHLDLDTLEYIP